jgi:hypothetical protein
MVELSKIDKIVAAYATATKIFITPGSMTDPLVPTPTALPPDTFSNFFFELLTQFSTAGVQIKLPMDDLRQCRAWQDVSILCFHHQL